MFSRCSNIIRWLRASASVVGLCALVSTGLSAEKPVAAEAMGLLQTQCLSCHNTEKKKGGLDMSTREHLLAGADGKAVVDTAKIEESQLLKALSAEADP